MLEFLRRYQHNIMIVVAVVVIISFAWFFAPHDDRQGAIGREDVFKVGGKGVDPEELKRQHQIFAAMNELDGGGFNMGGNPLSQLAGEFGKELGFAQGRNGQFQMVLTPEGEMKFAQNRIIIRDAAAKLGVEVSDKEIEEAIKKKQAFQRGGVFDAGAFEEVLNNTWRPMGLQPGDLRAAIADGLITEKLKSLLGSNSQAIPGQVEVDYQDKCEKNTVSLVEFKREDFEKDLTITDQQIKDYYEQRKSAGKPEVTPPGETAKDAQASVFTDEKRQIEYIFFEQPEHPKDKRKREEDAAKAAAPPPPPPPAEPAREENPAEKDKSKAGNAKKGKNTPMVDDESEPPGQAPPADPAPTPPADPAPPVDLSPPPAGGVPALNIDAPPAADGTPGLNLDGPPPAASGGSAIPLGQTPTIDISGGQGGPPAVNAANPAESAQIAKDEEENQKNITAFQEKVDAFYTELEKDPSKLKELAAAQGLEVKLTPAFSRAEPPADLKLPPELVGTLFSHNGNEKERSLLPAIEPRTSSPSEKKGYYVARITAHEDSREMTLEEAKAKLTEDLKKQEADKKLEAAANEKRGKLEEALKGGKKLEDAAKELGLTVRALPAFRVKDGPKTEANVEEPNKQEILAAVAETVVGGVSKLKKTADGKLGLLAVVQEREAAPDVKITEAAPAPGNAAQLDPEAEKNQLKTGLESTGQSISFRLWLEHQRKEAGIVENKAYLDSLRKR